jgi:hypothetical protein
MKQMQATKSGKEAIITTQNNRNQVKVFFKYRLAN